MHARLSVLAVASATACAAAVLAATDPPVSWTTPQRLSGARKAWFAEVATDGEGGVHAFWSENDAFGDLVMGCRLDGAGCADPEAVAKRAGTDGSYTVRPAAAAGADGTLHLLWRAKFEVVYQKLSIPDPEEGWSGPPMRLGDGSFPAIAVGPDGTLHMAVNIPMNRPGQQRCFACGDIHYRRSTDNGASWSRAVNLANSIDASDKPTFALGPHGELALAWEEGKDFYVGKGAPRGVVVAVSRDAGVTWDAATTFEDPADPPQSPAIGFDAGGALVLVWRQAVADGVFFRRSTDLGRTWSDPQRIEGLRRRHDADDELDDLAMASDSARTLHLLATSRVDRNAIANGLYHAQWDGEAWSEPTEIFRTNGAPEWPRLSIGEGNHLHAVWFERPEGQVWQSEQNDYRILYSHAHSAAPRVEPVHWPKPVKSWISPRQANFAAQMAGAFVIVVGVILWARRRGL